MMPPLSQMHPLARPVAPQLGARWWKEAATCCFNRLRCDVGQKQPICWASPGKQPLGLHPSTLIQKLIYCRWDINVHLPAEAVLAADGGRQMAPTRLDAAPRSVKTERDLDLRTPLMDGLIWQQQGRQRAIATHPSQHAAGLNKTHTHRHTQQLRRSVSKGTK